MGIGIGLKEEVLVLALVKLCLKVLYPLPVQRNAETVKKFYAAIQDALLSGGFVHRQLENCMSLTTSVILQG